ncbi:MAG: 50S ribosomal protein L1 [Candidatus Abawacabacteria bacterium RBG_16_42_10]|uniref:Large ribosomal subunit protein uL1 n=1 Tax=Candidatus Abawacabacteria bacterium RBG_16_42_10 TaxID=1817814 RepID=A0A1F4XKI7_9BACT|nr:MAG: 50S ribosomal protein L1 [Candidatus Abawacabacteria bacterium RBG_16_42_10]
MKRSKKYKAASAKFDRQKKYPLEEACGLLVDTGTTKFDSTVEVHFHLNIDPKYPDQQIRSTVSLPHGSGKSKIIAAFVNDDQVAAAKKAGADFAGNTDLMEKVVKENWTGFDVAVATPEMMPKIAKLGKILGTKGLMPNPKSGTVTTDIAGTIGEIKKGRIEFRNDPQGNLHAIGGKLSFGKEKIAENVAVIINAVRGARPTGIKGNYILSTTLTSTMGPGIRMEIKE